MFRETVRMRQVTFGSRPLWEVFFKDQDNPALLHQWDADVLQHEKKLMDAGLTPTQLKLIRTYGDLRYQQGREEVQLDWDEADAGEDL